MLIDFRNVTFTMLLNIFFTYPKNVEHAFFNFLIHSVLTDRMLLIAVDRLFLVIKK